MIVPKTSSPTFLAALVRGSHLSLRSPFSNQRPSCRFTFRAKTWTSQAIIFPLFSRFLYEKTPRGRRLTLPTTPASCRASRAADLCGGLPLAGQPFGMIHRPVSREVTSKTSVGDLPFRLYGKAAYWIRFAVRLFLDSTMTANATTHERCKESLLNEVLADAKPVPHLALVVQCKNSPSL
jgi:hypothetical protein